MMPSEQESIMTKTKSRANRTSNPSGTTKQTAAKASSPSTSRKNATSSSKIVPADVPRSSKQERVLGLLRRREGATVAAITKATGWQQHSVRGFLAGVVRKKLKLHLTVRDDGNGKRIYRIAGGRMPKFTARTAR
jgi:hypothetical protein